MLLEYFSARLLLIRLHALGTASSSDSFCIGLQLYQLAISQGNCTEAYCFTQLTWRCAKKMCKPNTLFFLIYILFITHMLMKSFHKNFSSIQSHNRVWLCNPTTTARQASPCPSPTPGVHPNSCPLSQWCHPTISFSVAPFSSCLHSFPALGSVQMSQLFTWGGQSIGISASTSVLPMNTQDGSPLGWTG